jgi:PAS domain S-box-containing protein
MNQEKYRVLILDDDIALGELLKEYLTNTKTCAVTYVTEEPDFWECLDRETFDILFLDYKLPNTTGLDILAQMGQSGINIPTVMMTGEGNENIAARAIQSGALDYLVKGAYSFTSLPPLIQKAVRLREMQRAMQQYLEQIRFQAMLLDNMRDAVVVWGLDGKITYWNTAAELLYSAPAVERLNLSVNEVYFPCFDPPLALPDLKQPGNIQIEHRYRLPNGERIWISAHFTTLYGENNTQPTGYMNVARDVTPRRMEQEALIQSQRFVQRILDTSPNIIYILDLRSQRIRYINPEIKVILGYPVEDFFGASFDLFVSKMHEEDIDQLAQHLHNLHSLRDGQVQEIEYRMLSKTHEWRWLKSRDTVFSRSETGTPVEIIGVIQDITASKQAEEKLQRRLSSERLLSAISNNFINLSRPETDKGVATAIQMVANFIQMDFASIALVDEGELTPHYSYDAHLSLQPGLPYSEYNLSPVTSKTMLASLARHEIILINQMADLPEDADCERERFTRMGLRSEVLIPMIFNGQLYGVLGFGAARRDLRWTEDDLYVLKNFGEMITNAMVQKQVDQALRKSEARYRAIVEDHQTEMICRFLPDTSLTFVNEAYCRFYSADRNHLIGTSFLDPVLDEDKATIRERLSELSAEASVNIFEQRVRLVTGDVRWQEWVSRAIFDQHNDFIEFQAVGRDITERKLMEEQLKVAQTHLAQAARLTSIGELASSVAHQISNPLTTIIAEGQLLSSELGRAHPARESADAIVQAGWRAQEVINELMKFSQPAQATMEPVSINDTIENAQLLASAHIQAFGVKIEVHLDPNLPEVSGNPRQLTDLWVNLLLLARTSFLDGAEHLIRVSSQRLDHNTIEVQVRDDGIPIPVEQYDKIFEPQLIPTGSGRGTGMELSLCREIVRQHHGQIRVSGGENDTTFHITFSVEGL